MEDHRRWFCRECKREWVEPRACYANSSPISITGNPINGSNCQVCGSPEIELVEYKPEWPGLDIPRDRINRIVKTDIVSVVPGQVTSGSYSIRNESLLGRPAEELITTNSKLIPVPTRQIELESLIEESELELESDSESEQNLVGSIFDISDMD